LVNLPKTEEMILFMVKPVELFYTLVYRSFRQNKKVSHGYTTKETLNISKAGKEEKLHENMEP